LKVERGTTKIRVLACASEPTVKHFVEGKPVECTGPKNCQNHKEKISVKYKTYVLVRPGNEIQTWDMPRAVFNALGNLQMTPDWEFDGLPMPYDVSVTYDPDASPNDKYKTLPSPKREEVPAEVLAELGAKEPLSDVKEVGDEEIPVVNDDYDEKRISPDEVPF